MTIVQEEDLKWICQCHLAAGKRILVIDDLRNVPSSMTARTFEDGIRALKEDGPWYLLILDHDLGQEDGKDGTGIINWLEEHVEYAPERIELITANPVGRERLSKVIKRIYERKEIQKTI